MNSTQSERDYYNDRYDNSEHRRSKTKSRFAYAAYALANKKFLELQNVNYKKILDIGCGVGIERAKYFIGNSCEYTGIDISDKCIQINSKESTKEKIQARFICDDANTLTSVNGEFFDLIILAATLHHLDFDSCLPAFQKILSKNGSIVMLEPMATNPFINLFRHMTPKLRTPDEHPLTFKDIKRIKQVFRHTTYELHTFTALASAPLFMLNNKLSHRIASRLSIFLGKLDIILGKIPMLNRMHWIVIIEAKA